MPSLPIKPGPPPKEAYRVSIAGKETSIAFEALSAAQEFVNAVNSFAPASAVHSKANVDQFHGPSTPGIHDIRSDTQKRFIDQTMHGLASERQAYDEVALIFHGTSVDNLRILLPSGILSASGVVELFQKQGDFKKAEVRAHHSKKDIQKGGGDYVYGRLLKKNMINKFGEFSKGGGTDKAYIILAKTLLDNVGWLYNSFDASGYLPRAIENILNMSLADWAILLVAFKSTNLYPFVYSWNSLWQKIPIRVKGQLLQIPFALSHAIRYSMLSDIVRTKASGSHSEIMLPRVLKTDIISVWMSERAGHGLKLQARNICAQQNIPFYLVPTNSKLVEFVGTIINQDSTDGDFP